MLLGAALAGGAAAAERIVVTGSVAERAAAQAPFAITLVDAEALRAGGAMLNLSESLVRVPGLVANNRHNYAQDLQLSSRGFGARAGFGVRGLRLYTDGIPATMPDGQGQPAHFDLAGAERVEVLRGPFSVLYGNSSGGVVALFTAPATQAAGEAALDFGSFGLRQLRAAVATPLDGGFDLRASAATMRIDGFRPHSAARRTLAHVRLGWRDADDRVTLLAGVFEQPAQDPLGLSRAQFDADPRQTTPQATQFDTRKSARQQQAGLSWQHRFDDGALRETRLALYAGARSVAQWLAIAPATQLNNAGHGGGVIDLDRRYDGAELRLRWAWERLDLVAGAAVERQHDARRGFANFIGPVLGTTGALRRDERNTATTRDLFAQAEWAIAPDWSASAGLRAGRVRLAAADAFLANGDDSGRLAFGYRNPVLGLRWQATRTLALHASAARGFESPTLGELAYRTDGVGGFNTALRPQTSRQLELGAKARLGDAGASLELALFDVAVADEIGVATNAGGRSSFQNIGRTSRRGAELALQAPLGTAWRTALALSTLEARNLDAFLACAGIPCTAPSVPVPAGNRLAGTQARSLWAELAWRNARFGELAVETRALSRTAANDVNSEFAPGHTLLALRWTRGFAVAPGWRAEAQLRVDNATGRRAVGSVIVNDANGRFYEPQAPLAVLLSLRLQATR
jgi:iron complex outermembrane receptor protein